jgi:AcrR family transcriptional regulator
MAQAKTAKAGSKKTETSDREKIISAYKERVLLEGHAPHTVFQFMHSLKMKESDFYTYFGSFKALERAVWSDYFRITVATLRQDDSYMSFSSREKLLSFYFTLIEVLKNDRSFVMSTLELPSKSEITPSVLRGFREEFQDFVQEIINEGRETEEIKDRRYLSDRYKDGIWVQTMFILHFWINDESEGFMKTDAAIEKAVNLSYELMGAGPLDKLFDFAKFLYQNRP